MNIGGGRGTYTQNNNNNKNTPKKKTHGIKKWHVRGDVESRKDLLTAKYQSYRNHKLSPAFQDKAEFSPVSRCSPTVASLAQPAPRHAGDIPPVRERSLGQSIGLGAERANTARVLSTRTAVAGGTAPNPPRAAPARSSRSRRDCCPRTDAVAAIPRPGPAALAQDGAGRRAHTDLPWCRTQLDAWHATATAGAALRPPLISGGASSGSCAAAGEAPPRGIPAAPRAEPPPWPPAAAARHPPSSVAYSAPFPAGRPEAHARSSLCLSGKAELEDASKCSAARKEGRTVSGWLRLGAAVVHRSVAPVAAKPGGKKD